jgi:lipoic acid synthetase/lipoyl(octanoyl) transferase
VTNAAKTCYALSLGAMEYARALELQLQICAAKKNGFSPDVLLLLEHPPTITLGKSGKWQNLLVSDEVLRSRGVTR